MDQTEVTTIDDLPELPFKRVLSYLSLEDLIKARAVSRGWYHRINSSRVKSLCCSGWPEWMLKKRRQLVSGVFAQNFIRSLQFATFFTTFSPTILANLKHLRLYALNLPVENVAASVRMLNAPFCRLEELDIIQVGCSLDFQRGERLKLSLPMLTSIRIEFLDRDWKLSLDTPRLQKIKLLDCFGLSLELVHGESVERLLLDDWQYLPVKNLKNLRHLYIAGRTEIDSTFLSSLEQLREISLEAPACIQELFEQKKRHGRANLKIYRFGCLLNGPEDPLMSSDRFPGFHKALAHLVENPARLADELPLYCDIRYSLIELVATESADILKRCTDLFLIHIDPVVQDVQHFLNLLKSSANIVYLYFYGDQPQNLFDQLPEHSTVECLYIERAPSDYQFLFRLKSLGLLSLGYSVGIETILRIWQAAELPLLSSLEFQYLNNKVRMEKYSNQFEVWVNSMAVLEDADLNSAIDFIVVNVQSKRVIMPGYVLML